MFAARDVNPEEAAENEQDGSLTGKGFAQSGGVAGAVKKVLAEEGTKIPFTCATCNGAKECKRVLSILNAGRLPEDFVEGMACEGGCIAGPAGAESLRIIKKNRSKLLAQADSRTATENISKLHDFSNIRMD